MSYNVIEELLRNGEKFCLLLNSLCYFLANCESYDRNLHLTFVGNILLNYSKLSNLARKAKINMAGNGGFRREQRFRYCFFTVPH